MTPEERGTSRPKLLPRLSILGLLAGIAHLISRYVGSQDDRVAEVVLSVFTVVGMLYMAWVILRINDMLKQLDLLHPTDAMLCQLAGPLAGGIGVGLLIFAGYEGGAEKEPIWLTSRLALQVIHFIMEVGFVLAVACLLCRRDLGPVPPVFFWKAISTLLAIVFGMYALFIPLVRAATILKID